MTVKEKIGRLFYPSSFVPPNLFIGRNNELEKIIEGLESTKTGNGQNFIVFGKTGIGKSTLLKFIGEVATNKTSFYARSYNYISVNLLMRKDISLIDFLHKFLVSMEEIKKRDSNAIKNRGLDFWNDISIFDVNIFGLASLNLKKEKFDSNDLNKVKDVLFKTIIKILEKISSAPNNSYDGLLIMIDESNYIAENDSFLDFFRELVLEINSQRSENKLMLILAGVSERTPPWLKSIRNTFLVKLNNLSSLEVGNGLRHKYFQNQLSQGNIDNNCIEVLRIYSKGHPYLFQKFGLFFENNAINGEFKVSTFIWGIFHPRFYDHELKKMFNEESYLRIEDKKILTQKVDQVVVDTFVTLAPGCEFELYKFWDNYFNDPENLFMHCQIEILTYWEGLRNRSIYLKKISKNNSFKESWKERPLIIDWLSKDIKTFRNSVAKVLLYDASGSHITFSVYYFSIEQMNSVNEIAEKFLTDVKTVWIGIIKVCKYLEPLAKLYNSSIEIKKQTDSIIQGNDADILNYYRKHFEDKDFDSLPNDIEKIGKTLSGIKMFNDFVQYNL